MAIGEPSGAISRAGSIRATTSLDDPHEKRSAMRSRPSSLTAEEKAADADIPAIAAQVIIMRCRLRVIFPEDTTLRSATGISGKGRLRLTLAMITCRAVPLLDASAPFGLLQGDSNAVKEVVTMKAAATAECARANQCFTGGP
ncbi:MAG: hypothetical protein KDJ68_11310 [Rhodobiaceae bacterium]|nr:hypothetical protein [Rhodobiaceae bacterium]